MMVSSGNYSFIVKQLLKAGADPNITDKNGNTALIFAPCHMSHDIVRELLKHGADSNLQNKNDDTALTLSSKCANKKIKKLLEYCIDGF